jgi:hypothetical protein
MRTGFGMRKYLVIALGVLLSTSLHAENAQMLESFETGIDSAGLLTPYGGRPILTPPGVTLSQYTKSSGSDENVTEGNKCLKIVLSGSDDYSADFRIQLSSGASDKIRDAAASKDVARYILRYDVIFPPIKDFDYFNSALHLGSFRDVLVSAGGKRSMSVPLDLIKGLPEDGPVTLEIFDDFVCKGTFTNVTVYYDNIRLVDTYAPGAKPVVKVLQSFEDPKNPTGGVTNFTAWDNGKPLVRTTFSQYTATGPDDVRASDGQHALEVIDSDPRSWHADFTIPFKGTALADLLKLGSGEQPTREQLSHYTLRWDVMYPDLKQDEWINSTYSTTKSYFPIVQVRQNRMQGQRQTYSVTLDQIHWDNPGDGNPVLLCMLQGPQKTKPVKIYYDNFRLIDTGHIDAGPKGGR